MRLKREGLKTIYRTDAARRRATGQAAQSAVVAIIVLFLLLFLAGIFIAIISGNIKNTRAAANTTQAGKYSEAGVRYLDDQLTNSAEGADWRPVPDFVIRDLGDQDPNDPGQLVNYDVDKDGIVNDEYAGKTDPDYMWVRLPNLKTGTGGYTRVNFGSDIPGARERGPAVGGRSLVRITYAPNVADPLSRYIRLDSVGRVGQIDPRDPTTYTNTEGLDQRVELVAYKGIGLNEYVRQVTNKDDKPGTVSLGVAAPVRDRDKDGLPIVRNIESLYRGPIRVNAPLTFYGVNRIVLDPTRNEAIEVAGPISLNNVSDATTALTAMDATRVYISTVNLKQNVDPGLTPNLWPSASPNFTTLGPKVALDNQINANPQDKIPGFALIRDNPRGSDTSGLTQELDVYNNSFQNLRTVGRTKPPVIDASTGADGMTRYRALTRGSAPLSNISNTSDPNYSMGTGDNPIGPAIYANAGLYGWGQGMYIDNYNDVQNSSTTLFGGYSLRNDWLNPPSQNQLGFANGSYWQGDFKYVPPAVTITLTPRGIIMSRSPYFRNRRQDYSFRNPVNGQALSDVSTILRYTPIQGFGAPTVYSSPNALQAFAGYPAQLTQNKYYEGDYVIHAEGNIRIKGVAGGLDPETKKYFIRHLTVVSDGTIYVDGNLLRDNITAQMATADITAQNTRGRSTIALLAKNYIAVNTTQFLSPSDGSTFVADRSGVPGPVSAISLSANQTFNFSANFGPIFDPLQGFITPPYLTTNTTVNSPALFLRHTGDVDGNTQLDTYINVTLNESAASVTNYIPLTGIPGAPVSPDTNTLSLGAASKLSYSIYAQDRITLPPGMLFPTNVYPYNTPNLAIGLDNQMKLRYDTTANVPYTTPGANYLATRIGVAPLDIRIEALMYAQEYSFFIIPGPWFNPNPNDTPDYFIQVDPDTGQPHGRRYGENVVAERRLTEPRFPFFHQPMDIRITFCGSITENLPAEVADQGAWMEKWGWIPDFAGSTGLTNALTYFPQGGLQPTVHGRQSAFNLGGGPLANNIKGNGLVYEFDYRSIAPYVPDFALPSSDVGKLLPLRVNPYNPSQPLPFAPRLPVAPGFLYYGQNTQR